MLNKLSIVRQICGLLRELGIEKEVFAILTKKAAQGSFLTTD
jgi:hypothetical protein